jgi:hypothetical protein
MPPTLIPTTILTLQPTRTAVAPALPLRLAANFLLPVYRPAKGEGGRSRTGGGTSGELMLRGRRSLEYGQRGRCLHCEEGDEESERSKQLFSLLSLASLRFIDKLIAAFLVSS